MNSLHVHRFFYLIHQVSSWSCISFFNSFIVLFSTRISVWFFVISVYQSNISFCSCIVYFVELTVCILMKLPELPLNNYLKFFIRQFLDLHFCGIGYQKIIEFPCCHFSVCVCVCVCVCVPWGFALLCSHVKEQSIPPLTGFGKETLFTSQPSWEFCDSVRPYLWMHPPHTSCSLFSRDS